MFKFKDEKHEKIFPLMKIIFKNSFFILFSFVNMFIPLYATIIASLLEPNGALNVISIGLSISFITIFNQFLFLLSIALLFVFRHEKKSKQFENILDHNSITAIMFIFSVFSFVLFIATCSVYVSFSSIYSNINLSVWYGIQLILMISPSLLLNGLFYLNIIYNLEINKKRTFISYLLFFVLHLIFIPVFYLLIPFPIDNQPIGLGLGFFVPSLIMFILTLVFEQKDEKIIFKFDKESFKYFMKKSNNFIWNFLLATIMKIFLIMAIALELKLYDRPAPLGLTLTKIIWYNSLFFCGFFGDGLFYTIEYSRIKNIGDEDTNPPVCMKAWLTLAIITFFTTAIITISFNFVAMSLAKLYPSHQTNIINHPYGDLWPYNNDVSKEIQGYLWCPSGMYNMSLFDKSAGTFSKTPTYSLLYLSIYHCLINVVKILSITDIKFNNKFDWKKLISNFIVLTFIMSFIATFSIAFNEDKSFISVFQGVDTFSFALMTISILFFILNSLGFIMKWKKNTNLNIS